MSYEILQAIADIYKKNDPEDSGFYTLEWVQKKCASFYQSPEEYLTSLQEIEARIEAMPAVTGHQPWVKDLPAHYIDKLSGPIDALSYQLMEKSGELAKLDAAMDEQIRQEQAAAKRDGASTGRGGR